MLRSLFSGVTGLRNHQTKMDVIGNNIANVNTAGFKCQRVVFKDLYYQTISSATGSGTVKGGKNPMQIGYGSAIASIDVLNNRSGIQTTDLVTDLYIAGDGYFQVRGGTGDINYTRVGNFTFDDVGNLVDSNGYKVCGYKDPANPTTVETIQIPNINNYSELSFSKDGTISAINSATGNIEILGQIVIAKFPNANGLTQMGNQYLKPSPNSGAPVVSVPGTNATGEVVSGGLEMSNVDLSKEFTDMIVTQRGFQANSRVITTSDEILQELVNLKR